MFLYMSAYLFTWARDVPIEQVLPGPYMVRGRGGLHVVNEGDPN